MAKIWFLKEGEELARGGFEIEKTLPWCVDHLELEHLDWEAPLSRPPHFGDCTPLDDCNLMTYVVVEIGSRDRSGAADKDWKAGFYLSCVSVEAARTAMGTI